MVVGIFFEDESSCLGDAGKFLFQIVLSLVVDYLVAFQSCAHIEHDFFFHLAFLSQIFDVLQILLQFCHLPLGVAFLILVFRLFYGVLLPLGLQFLDLALLLFAGLADVVVLLAGGEQDAVGCGLGVILGHLGLLPQLEEVATGGEGEVVVPGWLWGYLMLLLMALRAGSLTVSLSRGSSRVE